MCLCKVDMIDWSAERRLQWEQRELKTLDWATRGKRLKPCPRKASARSGNQRHT